MCWLIIIFCFLFLFCVLFDRKIGNEIRVCGVFYSGDSVHGLTKECHQQEKMLWNFNEII